jgi:hypothetical protein
MENFVEKMTVIFRRAKLVDSFITAECKVDEEDYYNLPKTDIEKIVKRDLSVKFAEEVLKKEKLWKSTVGHHPLHTKHTIQAFVVSKDDMKFLVEAIIQTMPDEVIQQIKQGKQVLSKEK